MLLHKYDIETLVESEREQSPELAEWVFETRCEIEEADSRDELLAIQMEIQTQYNDKVELISQMFETPDGYKQVKKELDQTKYYIRMLDEIDRKLSE